MLVVAFFIHVPGYLIIHYIATSRGISHSLALSWDSQIPYLSFFSPFYALVYVLPVLSFFLIIKDDELLKRAFGAYCVSGLVCLLVFALYPVEFTLRAPLLGNSPASLNALDQLTYFFYWADSPALNCFPSMHVAGAFLCARMMRLYRATWGPFFYFLALMITLSTLLIRQHFILDVVGGYALYFGVSAIFFPKSFRSEVYGTWLPWRSQTSLESNEI